LKATRVLIADDHEVVRKGVRALIGTRPEYEIVGEATDGRDAVEKSSKLKPDLVILDISMQGLNGLEATRQIIKETPQTQVLILTVHDSQTVASQALEAGARGYVLKSDAGRDLLLALEAMRRNTLFLSPAVGDMLLSQFRGKEKHGKRLTRFQQLTPREREVLQLLAEAKSNKEVAQVLGISLKTVDAHRSKIMSKLGLHSVAELVRVAIREGVIEP
jgi:two-component system response regulator NreC